MLSLQNKNNKLMDFDGGRKSDHSTTVFTERSEKEYLEVYIVELARE